jgi:hypothetical protein
VDQSLPALDLAWQTGMSLKKTSLRSLRTG